MCCKKDLLQFPSLTGSGESLENGSKMVIILREVKEMGPSRDNEVKREGQKT